MYRFFRKNREAVKKYLLIFFLGIVSIGMVVTLAPLPGGNTSQMEANVLASIDGISITAQELRRNVDAQMRNSSLANNRQLAAKLASSALDEMVLRHALLSQAKALGIDASNQELMQSLKAIPFLYSNGAFIGLDRYQDLIQQETGMTVSQFEAQLRESIILEKMRNVIADSIQVSPAEVREEFEKRNAKAKIEYVLFDPSQYLQAVNVAPEALENYLKKDPDRYKVPQERRVRYVLVDPGRIQALVKVTDADLKQYYSEHLSDYRVPDRVMVSHILFKTTGKTPEEIAKVTGTAQDVLKQLKTGADFAELAKKYSEDTTAQNGGDLGWIVRGQTVKEFEQAAFSMKPGQISDLVTTTYGIHILKVSDKQLAHLQTFDEVKDSVRSNLEKEKLAAAQESFARKLERELKANPKEFGAVARKEGLEVKETPLFKYKQAVPDLGNDEGLQNLVFELREGEVGGPVSLPKGLLIVQLVQIVPEHTPKLDEVRAQVEEDYRAEEAKKLARQKAGEFASQVKNGDFKKVAQKDGLTVKESKEFTRTENLENLISGTELGPAFTLAPGQTSDALSVGTDYIVFKVVSQTPPDQASFAQQQEQIREQLLNQKRSLAFEIYRQNLKQELQRSGKLKINDSALKQFLSGYQRS
jgi:peptidyl-prolyl cis-trans isomerase D